MAEIHPDIAALRREYHDAGLLESQISKDPFQQFHLWFEHAREAQIVEPNAMTLATVDDQGRPDARMVLLKELDDRGFIFFTNYQSRKARQLAAVPHAALVFWWDKLERQVRVLGPVEKVDPTASQAYFTTRPRGSQLGAWASTQSTTVPDRQTLDRQLAAVEQEYADQDVPCPPHWGGYRLVPETIEFWQGRRNRMHDRLLYQRDATAWQITRLSP